MDWIIGKYSFSLMTNTATTNLRLEVGMTLLIKLQTRYTHVTRLDWPGILNSTHVTHVTHVTTIIKNIEILNACVTCVTCVT